MADQSLPKDFLWGASTAAYQVEGGIENVDWAQAARDGRVPTAGRACDHYHRFEEDFDIAARLGMNAQRFSIEWARIEPEEGRFDEAEIEHYRQVLEALRERGLTPVVNLWHFTLPLWFSERGGFLSAGAHELFARYCHFVVERLGGYAHIWLTINEPEVWGFDGYLKAQWPPFVRNPVTYLRVQRALVHAHRAAYEAMKTVRPEIRIGIAKHNIFFESDRNPLHMLLRVFADRLWNHWFLRRIEDHQDVIGLNHYFHLKFGMSAAEKAAAVRSDMGWELHPTSLYECLVGLKRYNVPVFVSEHGLADRADVYRARFLRNARAALARARAEGVPLFGYFHWSLLDNYEWAHGFTQRFGLIELDYDTLERKPRPSAQVYAAMCRGEIPA
jgi:beta-glucosidase